MKRAWVLFLFLLLRLVPEAEAQQWLLPAAERIVPDDSCVLQFPNGKDTFYEMFRRWDTLLEEGTGNVDILHIGGSHVQAGTFSHQVRYRLLQTAPQLTARRGFLFPFSVAKTNNPYNYKVSYGGNWSSCKNTQRDVPYKMGLSGMVVATQDRSAQLSVRMRNHDGLCFDFNRLRLFGYSDSGRVEPLLQTADTVYRGAYDSASRTYLFALENYVDSFNLVFRPKDSVWEPFFVRGFLADNDLPGFTYHAVGVNGASVPSYLQCPLFGNDLKFLHPDLCIFGIGINDASGDRFDTAVFRHRYELLISEIQQVSPDCRFLFITNNDSYRKTGRRRYAVNTNGLLARDVFYRLAEEYGGAVFDQFALMGGLKSMARWQSEGLAQADKVHFTVKGYRYLGDMLYHALMQSYKEYLETKK